jgi:hypothetical protein
MPYKFISGLSNTNYSMSSIAYMYQDTVSGTYYISRTGPEPDYIIDDSRRWCIIDNEPKIIKRPRPLMDNIEGKSEVSWWDWYKGVKNGWILDGKGVGVP